MLTALFLAACPRDSRPVNLEAEVALLEKKLRQTEFVEQFELFTGWATSTTEVELLLRKHRPHVLHFSSYGAQSGEIVLSSAGDHTAVRNQEFTRLTEILSQNVRCVVLNAVHSPTQTQRLAHAVDCTVEMNAQLTDQSAVLFTGSFYQSLAYGDSIQQAFDLGCTRIRAEQRQDNKIPTLLLKPGVNPAAVSLVRPLKVFFVYEPQDQDLFLELTIARRPLQRRGLIEFWAPSMIRVGHDRTQITDRRLAEADMAVLLMSRDFFGSNDAHALTVKAMARFNHGAIDIIPIIARECDWQESAVGHLQPLPMNGAPIDGTRQHRDKAWLEVLTGIRGVITDRQSNTARS